MEFGARRTSRELANLRKRAAYYTDLYTVVSKEIWGNLIRPVLLRLASWLRTIRITARTWIEIPDTIFNTPATKH